MLMAESEIVPAGRGLCYREDGASVEKEKPQCVCPRCRSPRTTKCHGTALAGYRKCIICGNCWQDENKDTNHTSESKPKEENDT